MDVLENLIEKGVVIVNLFFVVIFVFRDVKRFFVKILVFVKGRIILVSLIIFKYISYIFMFSFCMIMYYLLIKKILLIIIKFILYFDILYIMYIGIVLRK